MKHFDLKTQTYKFVQEKNLPVLIEKDVMGGWRVLTRKNIELHYLPTREKAVDFCRELGFNITAFITPKENSGNIFE